MSNASKFFLAVAGVAVTLVMIALCVVLLSIQTGWNVDWTMPIGIDSTLVLVVAMVGFCVSEFVEYLRGKNV